jgi:hypothetical protein
MINKIKDSKYFIIGLVVGATGGFLYWKYIGCLDGTCPLASNWLIMTIYGTILGGVLGNIFQGIVVSRNKTSDKLKNV